MTNKIIVLFSAKGGVGKTTIAASIAAELHRRGESVHLVDADPQQSLTDWHGGDGPLSELPIDTDPSERAAQLAVAAAKKSIVIVDTQGSASRTHVALLEVADQVVIPCRGAAMDARRAAAALELVREVAKARRGKIDARVLMSMTTRSAIVTHIRNELVSSGARVMGSEVGQRTAFAEAELYGSAPAHMGRSAARAAEDIVAVVDELSRKE